MNGRDILTTAVEGGIGYWAVITDYKRDKDLNWLSVTLEPEEEGDFEPVTITAGDCTRAAAKLVREKLANDRIIGYITGDDIDADAADCIVQVAAFGELVYG